MQVSPFYLVSLNPETQHGMTIRKSNCFVNNLQSIHGVAFCIFSNKRAVSLGFSGFLQALHLALHAHHLLQALMFQFLLLSLWSLFHAFFIFQNCISSFVYCFYSIGLSSSVVVFLCFSLTVILRMEQR